MAIDNLKAAGVNPVAIQGDGQTQHLVAMLNPLREQRAQMLHDFDSKSRTMRLSILLRLAGELHFVLDQFLKLLRPKRRKPLSIDEEGRRLLDLPDANVGVFLREHGSDLG